jgi:hypothetical protein
MRPFLSCKATKNQLSHSRQRVDTKGWLQEDRDSAGTVQVCCTDDVIAEPFMSLSTGAGSASIPGTLDAPSSLSKTTRTSLQSGDLQQIVDKMLFAHPCVFALLFFGDTVAAAALRHQHVLELDIARANTIFDGAKEVQKRYGDSCSWSQSTSTDTE